MATVRKTSRVNSIKPGSVETEAFHPSGFSGGEFEKQLIAQMLLGRLVSSDLNARAVSNQFSDPQEFCGNKRTPP